MQGMNLSLNEARSLASQIFNFYDHDGDGIINNSESRGILNDIYQGQKNKLNIN